MDGLSAAASVIAVIQISEEVVSRSSRYYKAVKNAKSDIENLLRELSRTREVCFRGVFEIGTEYVVSMLNCNDLGRKSGD